ncbi:deoxyribodipyrimidine photo-lyase [Octadecabacter sp. 1_MG-2023]|uniref:cryptochrome/photolyase family protein n=1 Tax=unclassified Octadecabacter TaxID=196158 RepID=UPI001C097C92|nr:MULTISPECIES: deoxyribodipyrimidine photo-lyase [unclassified Octadecabacter]MBU2993120.1 DNA photolyase family protein [Octadecabacter sp. B2R22]MDO6733428.1 deoxyribodipyrimidine photo-lyase [Octadecabacter sp. 1_MG-2023]
MKPVIYWVRRDLRLADNAALNAVLASGRPVIPVFINDALIDGLGAAAKFRFGEGLRVFATTLGVLGSQLVLRRGDALEVLRQLISETGAEAVYWNRLYDPAAKARDTEVKSNLKSIGIEARSFAGHLLFEPWTVETKTGGFYKVFTPMWKAVRSRDVASPVPAPSNVPAPAVFPDSDDLADWAMGAAMKRGANVLAPHMRVGEAAAQDRLAEFIEHKAANYPTDRDHPSVDGTSGLSENLTYGEISPATCWHAGWAAIHRGVSGAEVFCKELVWREFAYHLMHHTPHILDSNWKTGWDSFPWNTQDTPEVIAWKQGRTGVPFVDAAMRQMYVTGIMHNRGRMIVASYLTKHLMTHWRIGQAWFEDCLIDWDPASNAMGWQWAAGSGPDASPFFRIFNPVTQLSKFDPKGKYAPSWIAEGQGDPSATSLSYYDAIPLAWGLSQDDAYPEPVVGLAEGRARALDAYQARTA